MRRPSGERKRESTAGSSDKLEVWQLASSILLLYFQLLSLSLLCAGKRKRRRDGLCSLAPSVPPSLSFFLGG